jgi:hypothetical protein
MGYWSNDYDIDGKGEEVGEKLCQCYYAENQTC